MQTQIYINQVSKAINKYCKSKKYDFEYNDVLEFYKMHLNGAYLHYKNIDVVLQFRNQLEYINSLNL